MYVMTKEHNCETKFWSWVILTSVIEELYTTDIGAK